MGYVSIGLLTVRIVGVVWHIYNLVFVFVCQTSITSNALFVSEGFAVHIYRKKRILPLLMLTSIS